MRLHTKWYCKCLRDLMRSVSMGVRTRNTEDFGQYKISDKSVVVPMNGATPHISEILLCYGATVLCVLCH